MDDDSTSEPTRSRRIGPFIIYAIVSPLHWYVGKTFGENRSTENRFERHMTGKPGSSKRLWAAVQEHGREFFTQIILEVGDGNHCVAERLWYDIGILFESRECLNGGKPFIGGSVPGERVVSDETRAKMSAYQKGRPKSEETKAKISATLTGRKLGPQSPEWIRKRTEHRRGIPSPLKGKPNLKKRGQPSPLKGRPSPLRGRKLSPEHIAKSAASRTGIPLTEAHRQKQSETRMTKIVECGECDMVDTVANMTWHTRRTGHQRKDKK